MGQFCAPADPPSDSKLYILVHSLLQPGEGWWRVAAVEELADEEANDTGPETWMGKPCPEDRRVGLLSS